MSNIRRHLGMSDSEARSKTFSVDSSTLEAAQRVVREGHCVCLASRTKKGTPSVPNLHINAQDVTASGWRLLLESIASACAESASVLEPLAMIPGDQWSKVITLPSSISELKTVTTLRLYGSHLRRLPPDMGRMMALSNLDVYTSYSLHWFPYEITRCSALSDSRVSTRALYGNIKTRLPFPRLVGPVDALMPQTCSVCDGPFGESGLQVLWTTQRVATDVVPLLVYSCSPECTSNIPDAPAGYHPRPHRGGGGVGMPDSDFG